MNKERITLIRYRLERAQETLQDAETLFKNGSLFSAVNRIYYAMFYGVNALLLTRSLASSKHSGVKALFNREFIKAGLISKESGRFYESMFNFRQKGDYGDLIEFEREQVGSWLKRAKDFTKEITLTVEEIVRLGGEYE